MYKPTRIWGHYPTRAGLRCKSTTIIANMQIERIDRLRRLESREDTAAWQAAGEDTI